MKKKKLVVLSGAGISAESGIKTFRDSDGLWENHSIEEVATPQGFAANPDLVLEFYNQRRRQLMTCKPNAAHIALADAEEDLDVHIITQNVDNLHERAGSSKVLHLHGQLDWVCSSKDKGKSRQHWTTDLVLGDTDENGVQLRPDIVWFGEDVPAMSQAIPLVSEADYILIVGTSMQVYPAAGLVDYARPNTEVYYVDRNPATTDSYVHVIKQKATAGVPHALRQMIE